MRIFSRIFALITLMFMLTACQTSEQMAEKEVEQTAKAEAMAAERAAKAEAKMAKFETKLPSGFERVVGDDLAKIVSNTTVTGLSAQNTSWSYTVFRDTAGMMKGTSTNGAENNDDTGKWWIESDSVCSQWKNWSDGQPGCNRLYSNGEYFMTIGEDGAIMDGKKLKWTIESGNTANL